MDLCIITSEETTAEEQESIMCFLDAGCRIHVRKPTFTESQLRQWLAQFPMEHWNAFHLHGFPELAKELQLGGIHLKDGAKLPGNFSWKGTLSKSIHSLNAIDNGECTGCDYVFLSPVFNSLSKPGYSASFDHDDLARSLQQKPGSFKVFALGGIDEGNLAKARALGFDGAAVLGSIWQLPTTQKRLKKYQKLMGYE